MLAYYLKGGSDLNSQQPSFGVWENDWEAGLKSSAGHMWLLRLRLALCCRAKRLDSEEPEVWILTLPIIIQQHCRDSSFPPPWQKRASANRSQH